MKILLIQNTISLFSVFISNILCLRRCRSLTIEKNQVFLSVGNDYRIHKALTGHVPIGCTAVNNIVFGHYTCILLSAETLISITEINRYNT